VENLNGYSQYHLCAFHRDEHILLAVRTAHALAVHAQHFVRLNLAVALRALKAEIEVLKIENGGAA